jgi:hypothetical protein
MWNQEKFIFDISHYQMWVQHKGHSRVRCIAVISRVIELAPADISDICHRGRNQSQYYIKQAYWSRNSRAPSGNDYQTKKWSTTALSLPANVHEILVTKYCERRMITWRTQKWPKHEARMGRQEARKGRYTPSVRLSDFTVWRHTWPEKWVNWAVLRGNSAGLRNVLSSRLSHRDLPAHFPQGISQFLQFTCRHHDGII